MSIAKTLSYDQICSLYEDARAEYDDLYMEYQHGNATYNDVLRAKDDRDRYASMKRRALNTSRHAARHNKQVEQQFWQNADS